MIDMVGLVLSLVHRTPSSSMYSDEKPVSPIVSIRQAWNTNVATGYPLTSCVCVCVCVCERKNSSLF